MPKPSSQLFAALLNACRKQFAQVRSRPEACQLEARMLRPFPCLVHSFVLPGRICHFSAVFPHTVPEQQRAAVGQLFHRISSRSLFGTLLLDYDDGQARLAISTRVPEGREAGACLDRLVEEGLKVYAFALPLLDVLLDSELEPKEVMEMMLTES